MVSAPGAVAPGPGGALVAHPEPGVPVKRTMVCLLETSVQAYGDVVTALLSDLEQTSEGMEKLAWLAGTRSLLQHEGTWQAASEQLHWWDAFLAALPLPRLLSEAAVVETRKLRALHTRARLDARELALLAHRRAVDEALARPDLTDAERDRLEECFEDPTGDQWLVDLGWYERQATANLPPMPDPVPITAHDLDSRHSFAGFNAVQAMRAHPDLGPRAAWMDEALTQALVTGFHLPVNAARHHATQLTGIFWLALRRALDAGSHQLAISIEMLASAGGEAPIQAQFTRELLQSWLHYLETLPLPEERKALGQRVPLIGGLFRKAAPAALPAVEAPRRLTDGRKPGVWSRVKGALGKDDE